MTAWRREALALMPDQKLLIEGAENPMALWIDLHLACEDAILKVPMDRELVSAIFVYARRCLEWPNQDIFTAVVVAFYEDIVVKSDVRRHLHNWITPDEFEGFRSVFAYHLGKDGVDQFAKEFYAQRGSAPQGRKPK